MIGRIFLASAFSAMAISMTGCQGPAGNTQTPVASGASTAIVSPGIDNMSFSSAPAADQRLSGFTSSQRVYRNVLPASELVGTSTWGQFAQRRDGDSFEILNQPVSPRISSVDIPPNYTNRFPSSFSPTAFQGENVEVRSEDTTGLFVDGAGTTNTGTQVLPWIPTRQEYLDWIEQAGLTYKEADPEAAARKPAPAQGKVGSAASSKPAPVAVEPQAAEPEPEVDSPQAAEVTIATDNVVSEAPEAAEVPETAVSTDTPADEGAPPAADSKVHTVKKDESLWTIAKDYYGQGADWKKIVEANAALLPSPDKLTPGMKLVIP